MKDLQLTDILQKRVKALTRVSIYRDGKWLFVNLLTPTKSTAGQDFFLIETLFGLHKEGSTNPAKYAVKGSPGDYVSVDKNGVKALVTAAMYELLFPPTQQAPFTATNSQNLKDPNYLTKIQRESQIADSDNIVIGNRSLEYSSNKTFTVVETEAGLAQVAYDPNATAEFFNPTTDASSAPIPPKPGSGNGGSSGGSNGASTGY
jgi:hypothetical protein